MQLAVAYLGSERRRLPCIRVTDRHDVDVTVQHQRRAVARTGAATDQSPRLGSFHLHAGELRIVSECVEVDAPVIHVERSTIQHSRDERLRIVLLVGATDARNSNQVAEQLQHVRLQVRECVECLDGGLRHARIVLSVVRSPYVSRHHMERVTGIEPAFSAWEADVLPLNYTRRSVGEVIAPGH